MSDWHLTYRNKLNVLEVGILLVLLTSCYSTRQMQTQVALDAQYVLTDNEKIPNLVGLSLEQNETSYLFYWDWFGGKVYTHTWEQDKLIELGRNYFKSAIIAKKGTLNCDFYIQVSNDIKFREFGSIFVNVYAGLYDANGLRIKLFSVQDFSFRFAPSGIIFVYAILDGLSCLILEPILRPLGNYSMAESIDRCCARALNKAYSKTFEDVYLYLKQYLQQGGGGDLQQGGGGESVKREITGTGFAISPEYILTASHVIDGMKKVEVRFEDDSWHPAELAANIASLDIALLKIKDKRKVWLPLPETESAKIGDKIFTLGFPISSLLGAEIKYSEGVLNSTSGLQGDKSLYQISIPIQPGNSGGPVVTESGYLIAMVTSSAAVSYFYRKTKVLPQNINWAVKISNLRMLLGSEYDFPQRKLPKDRQELITEVSKSTCQIRCQ